ncbi:MAG: hypothetical protein ABFC84_16775 [Veillonellales bacterium]
MKYLFSFLLVALVLFICVATWVGVITMAHWFWGWLHNGIQMDAIKNWWGI